MALSQRGATLLGMTTILQWGAQVLISTYAVAFPPFQLIAMTFFIAFLVMLGKWLWNGDDMLRHIRHGAAVWAIGLAGLFGYYALYYVALRHAPAVDVALLVNLWPLLMVLFTGFLPGERLRWYHIPGCLIGAGGSVVLLGPAVLSMFDGAHLAGQLLAIASAIVWAAFCVSSRAVGTVPTDTVGWYCLATAALGLACHALFEGTVVTVAPSAWWATLALGIGPVGLAFFAWDIGVKRGNIRLLGVMAFSTPMISTALLIATGHGVLDARVAVAALLITGGTLLAAREEIASLARSRARPQGVRSSPSQEPGGAAAKSRASS